MINILISILGTFLLFMNWENSFLLITVCGFLQDPLRKIIPGEPVFLTTLAALCLTAVFVKLKLKRSSPTLLSPFKNQQNIQSVVVTYILIVVIQGILGYLRYNNPIMLAIGLLSYLIPFPILWVTWYANKKFLVVINQAKIYVIFGIIVAFTIFLSYLGFNWKFIQPVGEAMLISSDYGPLLSHSGLMRSGEIATWHIATAGSILLGYLIYKNNLIWYTIFLPILGGMFVSGLLTGRRKFIAQIVVFLFVYLMLYFYFQSKKIVNNNIFYFSFLITGLLTFMYFFPLDLNLISNPNLEPYLARGQTVVADDRLVSLGFNSIFWAINRFGYFGIGAGTAGLGMAHFGGVVDGAGGAGEGGLGKIVVELGIPGLIIIVYLLFKLLWVFWKNLKLSFAVNKGEFSCLNLIYFSLLIANVPMFISSSLLFGDLFILIIIGMFMGNLLGIKRALGLDSPQQSLISNKKYTGNFT
ncbi:hypothetical protein PN488_09255 [Nodularia spumigena CS-591/12]|uniref:hypothetical protein n=1 Tax=Nodularia spumigena TaxID=70799 RepID=UPI0023312820|nr:hypothetical protein [Nodularia spumigena]MDB9304565.1 hypothetical protein [Nodularia spumigena CS-591/12]